MNKSKEKNLFTTKESMRTFDTFRIIYVGLAVCFFVLTETGRFIYRPYIYANKIDDYGLADSIGNLGGIMVQIFFMLAVFNSPPKKVLNVFLFLVGGYILYEFVQPILPKGVFDWKDVFGTLIGGVIGYFIYIIMRFLVKNNKTYFVIK